MTECNGFAVFKIPSETKKYYYSPVFTGAYKRCPARANDNNNSARLRTKSRLTEACFPLPSRGPPEGGPYGGIRDRRFYRSVDDFFFPIPKHVVFLPTRFLLRFSSRPQYRLRMFPLPFNYGRDCSNEFRSRRLVYSSAPGI